MIKLKDLLLENVDKKYILNIKKRVLDFLNNKKTKEYADLLSKKESIQNENYYYDEKDLKDAGLEFLIGEDDLNALIDFEEEMISFYLKKLNKLEYEIDKLANQLANKIDAVFSSSNQSRSRYIYLNNEDFEIRFSDHDDRHFFGNRITLSYNADKYDVDKGISWLIKNID